MATLSMVNTRECSLCFESLKNHKVLPCGHIFCLGCIERCIGDKTVTFPCPVCQQDVKIPEGGAKAFTPSPTQPKCPNHNQREVDYYCNNCNIGLCLKCILGQHKEHETLDIESDETRNKAIEKLERSQKIIKNRIKNLEKTRSTLLESLEELESLCEDSCTKVTEKIEQIVSDVRKGCEQIVKDIRNNLEENRSKLKGQEKKIITEMNLLESNMESNISTETTFTIFKSLPRFLEIEKLGECRKDYNLCVQYLQWVGKDFSVDIDQVGSVISKSFVKPASYQFHFEVNNIEKIRIVYYNNDKFSNNNLVWGCGVARYNGGFCVYLRLLPVDNPKLNYCTIDYQISLLNINDDSQTITRRMMNNKLKKGGAWSWFWSVLPWSRFKDKNNGFLNSYGCFFIQFDISQIREISMK